MPARKSPEGALRPKIGAAIQAAIDQGLHLNSDQILRSIPGFSMPEKGRALTSKRDQVGIVARAMNYDLAYRARKDENAPYSIVMKTFEEADRKGQKLSALQALKIIEDTKIAVIDQTNRPKFYAAAIAIVRRRRKTSTIYQADNLQARAKSLAIQLAAFSDQLNSTLRSASAEVTVQAAVKDSREVLQTDVTSLAATLKTFAEAQITDETALQTLQEEARMLAVQLTAFTEQSDPLPKPSADNQHIDVPEHTANTDPHEARRELMAQESAERAIERAYMQQLELQQAVASSVSEKTDVNPSAGNRSPKQNTLQKLRREQGLRAAELIRDHRKQDDRKVVPLKTKPSDPRVRGKENNLWRISSRTKFVRGM